MRLWHNVVVEWPEDAGDRLVLLAAFTLARLPDAVFTELRFGIARWTAKALSPVMRRRRGLGRRAFDEIAARYLSADAQTLASAIHNTHAAGVERRTSEFSLMKSINSPGGNLARTILDQFGRKTRQGDMPR